MISDAARAAIAAMRAKTAPPVDRETSRREWEVTALADPLPEGTRIEPVTLGGIPAERVTCGPAEGQFLLLHGGGYVSGSPRTHRKLAAWIARERGLAVLVPDYRLAPEHPFPAALDDALAVWQALLAIGEPIPALGGDSAGGGLALALMLAARDRGLAQPCCAVLLSPWADLTGQGAGHSLLAATEVVVTTDGLNKAARDYAGAVDLRHPLLSPVYADLTGLPPLLIDAGGDEVLLDDAALIAAHAQAVGVETTFHIAPGLWHVWHHAVGEVPEADAALRRIGQFLQSHGVGGRS